MCLGCLVALKIRTTTTSFFYVFFFFFFFFLRFILRPVYIVSKTEVPNWERIDQNHEYEMIKMSTSWPKWVRVDRTIRMNWPNEYELTKSMRMGWPKWERIDFSTSWLKYELTLVRVDFSTSWLKYELTWVTCQLSPVETICMKCLFFFWKKKKKKKKKFISKFRLLIFSHHVKQKSAFVVKYPV